MQTPFTIPVAETEFHQGWREDHKFERNGKREFTRTINKALIALQDAANQYRDFHCDISGKYVADHNLDILADLVPAFCEIVETLADMPGGHSNEDLDEISIRSQALTEALTDALGARS